MGAKDSKPSFISYEDACKRVSESELKRLEDAFKKCAGSVHAPLSKAAFIQDVLGDGVPINICQWLYTTCGGTRRGICFRDLVCGLVLLTKGTQEQRIKFLWTLYSNDAGTHINKWDFIKALQAENISLHPPGVRPLCIASSESLTALFGRNSEKADFEEFRTWVTQRKDATVLTRWMLVDQKVSLTSELETPTFYQTLAGVTHLEEKDISALEKCFWSLQSRSMSGQLDLEVLAPLLSPPLPRAALPGLFAALDENRDGHIDFKELCCGLSAACRGPDCERIKFCFKVFDSDRDGFLNPKELGQMCSILTFVANESACGRTADRKDVERVLYNADLVYESLQESVAGGKSERRKHNTVASVGEGEGEEPASKDDSTEKSLFLPLDNSRAATNNNSQLMQGLRDKESLEAEECGGEKEWGLSQEDFLIWSVEKASLLITPLLTLINQVAHVVLGLRPLCRHHEQEIVLGWLSREVGRGYSVGQFWYLISTEWWNMWLAYTNTIGQQLRGNSGCPVCGRRSPSVHLPSPLMDEAVICDESFNSNETTTDSVSVGSSSSSSGVHSSASITHRPGPIVNSQLLQQNPYKVRSLTGEGGYLRRDVTLAEHRDFELVPDSLWKALAQWYGGPQPLPRQVIRPPDSHVELELYPKTLRVYRHSVPGHQNTTSSQSQSSWSGMVGGYGAAALSSVGVASYQTTSPSQPTRYLAYTAAFSRLATVKQVSEFICAQLALPREDVRLWTMSSVQATGSMGGLGELLEEEGMTLSQLGLEEGHRILLEVRNKDLTWPEELGALSSLAASGSGGRGSLAGLGTSTSPHPAGATGLHNLGNTCFMNAALQAVWNTGPLTMYFSKDMHTYEVNKENPHGTGGALALRFGELCKDVWCSGARSVAPLRVRWCISKHASRFSGGGQHDSQELLAWLLDALHEDLNRAPLPSMLPYVELRDSDGRPDQEVAQEAWELHTARNNSIITELFYGQLKSKVTCNVCGHESVRFDAFNMLSLPLPMENYLVVEVTVVLLAGGVPTRYGLRLNSDSRYGEIKERVAGLCQVPTSCMLLMLGGWPPVIPHNSHKITSLFCYIYETPPLTPPPHMQEEGGFVSLENKSEAVEASCQRMNGDCSFALSGGSGARGERNSISSDYDSSPVLTHNFLNSKNIGSLESNNGSSGYNSIQELDTQNPSDTSAHHTTVISARCNVINNNSIHSPKKMSLANRQQGAALQQSPVASVKSLNASPSVSKKLDGELRINRGRSEEALLPNLSKSNKNCPLSHKDISEGDLSSNCSATRWDEEQDHTVKNYLLAVHRKQSRQESYFLAQQKRKWETFGSPVVVEIREGCGGRELYAAVWRQVERLLSAPPPQPPDQANHATDCDDSLGYTFPFALRVVGPKALRCAVCPWTSFCRGCALPCSDQPLITNLYSYSNSPVHCYPTSHHTVEESCASGRESVVTLLDMSQLRDGEVYLAVDWEPTALHLRYQSNREKMVIEDDSVRECRAGATAPVQLQHCLHSFTQEEKLDEMYACSACSRHQPATKKLQIWRLPPVLVVHLKRFQFVNRKWIKSHKAVTFPFNDFDPTAFLASVPQETILRHGEVKQHRASKVKLPQTDETQTGEEEASEAKHSKREKVAAPGRGRERLISTSLSKTPVLDHDFVDFHQHKLIQGESPFDLKYRLYAVVSHSGMMNGGHYVTYARNPCGAWYCYNDSSCKELKGSPHPTLDPSAAYLLFYERLGVDHTAYLPDIQDRLPCVEQLTQLAEGEDADLKKMCSIS